MILTLTFMQVYFYDSISYLFHAQTICESFACHMFIWHLLLQYNSLEMEYEVSFIIKKGG